MDSYDDAKVIGSTSIYIDGQETRIEKLMLETGQEIIRLSFGKKGDKYNPVFLFSEVDLLELLHKAIHEGVLPRNFIGKLRERIEI